MSNPSDPSQPDHQQQRGQSPNPQQDGQQPEPPQPTRIEWNAGPPQADQAPWRGPAAFASPAPAPQAPRTAEPQQVAPPAGHEQPWVSGGTAQTAQEVADHWQSSQEAQHCAAPGPFQAAPAPAAEHHQQPAADYPPPAQPQSPSHDTPAQPQDHSFNEAAATDTTPAVQDPAPEDEPEALTIGRGRENTIVLDDMLVSRRHVRITADSEGLILEDLGSRNGTYVNGRRVERTHLSEGDRIGIGAATFEVRDGWLLNV